MKLNYFNSLELTNIVILAVVALIIFELRRDILEKLQWFVYKIKNIIWKEISEEVNSDDRTTLKIARIASFTHILSPIILLIFVTYKFSTTRYLDFDTGYWLILLVGFIVVLSGIALYIYSNTTDITKLQKNKMIVCILSILLFFACGFITIPFACCGIIFSISPAIIYIRLTKNEKQIVHASFTNETIIHSGNVKPNKSSILKTAPYLLLFSDLLVLVIMLFTSVIGVGLSFFIFEYLCYKYQNEYYSKLCLASEWENRNVKKVKTNLIIGSIISFLFLFIYLIMFICEPLLDFSINLLGSNLIEISYFIFIIASKLIGLFILNKTIFSFGKIKNKIDNGILIFKCILYAIYFFAIQYVCLILVMLMHVHFPT